MTIRTLPAPCWRIVDSMGEDFEPYGEGSPHYDDEVLARATLGRYPLEVAQDLGDEFTVEPYPHACTVVACDDCGKKAGDGVWKTVHYPDEAEARSLAPDSGDFVILADGTAWCGPCRGKPHGHVGADPDECRRCDAPADEHEPVASVTA